MDQKQSSKAAKKSIIICGKGKVAQNSLSFATQIFGEGFKVFYLYREGEQQEVNNKEHAEKLGITALAVSGYRDLEKEALAIGPEYIFLLQCSIIIKRPLLDAFPQRVINLHFGSLPKYRGVSPITNAILNGEEQVGVTLHFVDTQIDTGEIIFQQDFPIEMQTNEQVYENCEEIGVALVSELFQEIKLGKEIVSRKQNDQEATYYPKESIDYSNTFINFNQTSAQILNFCRAFLFPSKGLYPKLKFNDQVYLVKQLPSIGERSGARSPGTLSSETPLQFVTRDRFVSFYEIEKIEKPDSFFRIFKKYLPKLKERVIGPQPSTKVVFTMESLRETKEIRAPSRSCKKSNYLSPFFQENNCTVVKDLGVKIKVLKEVAVFPEVGSMYCFPKKKIFTTESIDLKESVIIDEMRDLIELNDDQNKALLDPSQFKESCVIDRGLSLLSAINNYWHLVIEQAPKLVLANQLGLPKDIPALVSDQLHPNFYEVLKACSGGRAIVKVPSYVSKKSKCSQIFSYVKVHELYHVADHMYLPFHPRFLNQASSVCLDIKIIESFISTLLSYYKIKRECDPSVKLFLRRNSSNRISPDQDALQDYALSKGFTIFEPELMSLEQQLRLCSKASVFMGFSGAGFTNSIFLPREAKKILFANRSFSDLVSIWDKILHNFYALDNLMVKLYENDIHGIPLLSEKNWRDIEGFFAEKSFKEPEEALC